MMELEENPVQAWRKTLRSKEEEAVEADKEDTEPDNDTSGLTIKTLQDLDFFDQGLPREVSFDSFSFVDHRRGLHQWVT